MYKKIIHWFVLSCEKATFLIEKQLHTSLSPVESVQLRIHLSLCKFCASYQYKAVFMDKLMANERTADENGYQFSDQEIICLKEKFKSTMKKRTDQMDEGTLL